MNNIQPNFDALRIALMEAYNQKVTNHTGYIISLAIAAFTIFLSQSTLQIFTDNMVILFLLIGFLLSLLSFFILRIVFWAWMGSEVLYITESSILRACAPTNVACIQTYLIDYFCKTNHRKFSLHHIASLNYRLHRRIPFLPLVIIFLITLAIILPVGYYFGFL